MARCYNCRKIFDYEKYYGICPKCGAFNRENTPEGEHKELHETYDTTHVGASHYHGHTAESHCGSASTYHTSYGNSAPGKTSSAGTIVFVLLIIGIVATVLVPLFYFFGTAVYMGVTEAFQEDTIMDGNHVYEREEQYADITDAAAGETCYLGKNGEVQVTVEKARVLVPTGHVNDFPENEKLICITVSFDNTYEEYYGNYYAVDKLYVGYNDHTFKGAVDSYAFEGHMKVLSGIRVVEAYDICYGEGTGEILVFVPEEINNIDFYLESRDEENYEMLEIYRIPLEIKPGEEI